MNRMTAGLLLFATSATAFASSSVQDAADDICRCMAEPNQTAAEFVQQMMQAQASGDMSQIKVDEQEMTRVMNAAMTCFEGLPAKYPDIDQSDELKRQVMALTEQQCPNPALQMFRQR